MPKSPWTLDRLQAYVGQEEGYQLEFKSSLGLLEKPEKFFNDLSADVSAFINSEGGLLIVGIEEAPKRDEKQAGKAVGLSQGIPRSKCNKDKLTSAVCDRIHPSVASYVQVYPVIVGKQNDEELLAFVIEVSPGITAYQATDKRYYSRRSSGNDPMEDKDVRLRMMADDRPRGKVLVKCDWSPRCGSMERYKHDTEDFRRLLLKLKQERGDVSAFTDEDRADLFQRQQSKDLVISIQVYLVNIGVVTIREGTVTGNLECTDMGAASIEGSKPEASAHFNFMAAENTAGALYPEMEKCIAEWRMGAPDHWEIGEGKVMLKNVSVYLDNGAPAARDASFDLTEEFWDTVLNGREKLLSIARGE